MEWFDDLAEISEFAFSHFFCVLASMLFVPTILILYNLSAWVYMIGYGVAAMIGNAVGMAFNKRINEKYVSDSEVGLDALKMVKGSAIPFAMMYRIFAKKYTLFMVSQKNKLDKGYSTRDMAADQAVVMKKLGIFKASVMGVSEGETIAQYLAYDKSGR